MRRMIGLVAAGLVAAALTLTGASPAAAAGVGCSNGDDGVSACVFVQDGGVYGDALDSAANFTRVTVYVEQCRPTVPISGCGVIAANSKPQLPNWIWTSTKPAALGHIYHACASWRDSAHPNLVFECGDWRSWP
jgi:hypothetical protein